MATSNFSIHPPRPSRGYPVFVERGEKIKNILIAETQQNSTISRSELLSILRSEGYELTQNRLNNHLRDAGIREVTQWTQPNSVPLKKKATARKVVQAREIIRKAITNGQGSTPTHQLSEYLLDKHSLALQPASIWRNIRAMGFVWAKKAPGQFGWATRDEKRLAAEQARIATRDAATESALSTWAARYLQQWIANTSAATQKARKGQVSHVLRVLGPMKITKFRRRHMLMLRKSIDAYGARRGQAVMTAIKGILKLAGVWNESLRVRPVKMGRNRAGKEFVKQWMKHRPCVQCGRLRRRVLRPKDGGKIYNGLTNLSIGRVKAELAKLDVICLACIGKEKTGFNEDRANEIKEALLGFKSPADIAHDLRTDKDTVKKMAAELAFTGQVCFCGENLGHYPLCADLKAIKQHARAHQDEPAPVREVVTIKRDPNLCTERPCPFPKYRDGLCLKHHREFAMAESFTDNALDMNDYIPQFDRPEPVLSMVYASDLRNPRFRTVRNGELV